MSITLIAEVEDQKSKISIQDFTPRAFGYNIELDANVSITKALDVLGRAGINYTVFVDGPHSWFPYLYLHAGYSFDTIISKNMMKTVRELVDPKKAKNFFKLSAGVSANVSPFVAFRKCSDLLISVDSWEGWFMSSNISAKLKAGVGINIGGSIFVGSDNGIPSLKALDVPKSIDEGRWWGASLDVGIGVGTPSVDITYSYASFYWLMDEYREYSWKKDGLNFAIRWIQFIKLKPDIVTIIESMTGIKFPDWLKKVINSANLIVQREHIKTQEDYEMAYNKTELDAEYKQILNNKGLTDSFFIALENEQIDNDHGMA